MREFTYEQRQALSCKVCGNCPDEEGELEHGRGCYTQSADGGGQEHFDLDEELGHLYPEGEK